MTDQFNPPPDSVEIDRSPFSLKTSVVLLILGVGVGYTITTMFAVVVTAVMLMSGPSIPADVFMKLGLLVGTVSFIAPAYYYMRYCHKHPVHVFRLRPVPPSVLASTVALALGLFVVTDAIDRMIAPTINAFLDSTIGTLSPELLSDRILEKIMAEFTIKHWLSGTILILAAVVAAGVCEEMLLRGMFQQALESRWPAGRAILISSLVFAFIHLNPWGGIQIFIIALFLGLVAWKTGSILPTVLMHGVNNLLAIVIHNIGPDRLTWYGNDQTIETPALIGGVVLLLIGGFGIMAKPRGNGSIPTPHQI